jgi:hypothetical protein
MTHASPGKDASLRWAVEEQGRGFDKKQKRPERPSRLAGQKLTGWAMAGVNTADPGQLVTTVQRMA